MSCNQGNKNKDIIVSATPNEKGYLMVHLYRKRMNKTVKVHRLVAEAFVPNPDGLPEVNHIDGNKSNNSASNLEWVTRRQNMRHARETGALDKAMKAFDDFRDTVKTPVIARNIKTGEETMYESVRAAARACGTQATHITQCVKGKRKTTNGFSFRKAVDK